MEVGEDRAHFGVVRLGFRVRVRLVLIRFRVDGENRVTDRVLDRVGTRAVESYVRTDAGKHGREQGIAGDELQSDVHIGFRNELVIDQVPDDLRLVTAGHDPHVDALLLGGFLRGGADGVVVGVEGADELLHFVRERLEEVRLSLRELLGGGLD